MLWTCQELQYSASTRQPALVQEEINHPASGRLRVAERRLVSSTFTVKQAQGKPSPTSLKPANGITDSHAAHVGDMHFVGRHLPEKQFPVKLPNGTVLAPAHRLDPRTLPSFAIKTTRGATTNIRSIRSCFQNNIYSVTASYDDYLPVLKGGDVAPTGFPSAPLASHENSHLGYKYRQIKSCGS